MSRKKSSAASLFRPSAEYARGTSLELWLAAAYTTRPK